MQMTNVATAAFSAGSVLAGLRGRLTVRRLRLASGLVLFGYVAGHFVMHALGNGSLDVMEAGAGIHRIVWQNPLGTLVLYGAFAIHFGLALWALYVRRSFRMGAAEWARLA